jgi:hypothetical protein
MLLSITNGSTQLTDSAAELAAAREHFATKHFLKLPGFLEPSLLATTLDLVDRAPWFERVHPGIGTELCVEPGTLSGTLEFLTNDEALFAAIDTLTGCGPIGCFDGRIYRLVPGAGHYDSWHSDVGKSRMIALSLNLGRAPFHGGALQIRRADSTEVISNVDNRVTGDAIIFQVDPGLRHRVDALTGDVPRTAWAGWFCREPSYQQLRAARQAGAPVDLSAH